MRRIGTSLLLVIIMALAVHLVWVAIAPLIPYAVGGFVAIAVLGVLMSRRRSW